MNFRPALFGPIAALAVLIAPSARASSPPENTFGASVVGFAGFLRLNIGSYELFYERQLMPRHAVRFAFDFIHVHQAADYSQTHQWTFGGSATYRYYLTGGASAPFTGLRVGYRRGFGHFGAPDSAEHLSLINQQLSVIPQLGFRFMLDERLAVVAHLGVGYGPYEVQVAAHAGHSGDDGDPRVRFSRDVLGILPIAVDSELSLALSF